MLYHWATETLPWARSIIKFIWHASCILLGWTTSIASCLSVKLWIKLYWAIVTSPNNYQVNDTVDLRGLLLSSLPIKTSPIYITSEAIAEIHFERRNSHTRSFRLISWDSSYQITRQWVKFKYPIDSSKKCTFTCKRRRLIYASQVFTAIHAIGWPHVKLCQNSEKLKMPTPYEIIETSCRVSGGS